MLSNAASRTSAAVNVPSAPAGVPSPDAASTRAFSRVRKLRSVRCSPWRIVKLPSSSSSGFANQKLSLALNT